MILERQVIPSRDNEMLFIFWLKANIMDLLLQKPVNRVVPLYLPQLPTFIKSCSSSFERGILVNKVEAPSFDPPRANRAVISCNNCPYSLIIYRHQLIESCYIFVNTHPLHGALRAVSDPFWLVCLWFLHGDVREELPSLWFASWSPPNRHYPHHRCISTNQAHHISLTLSIPADLGCEKVGCWCR